MKYEGDWKKDKKSGKGTAIEMRERESYYVRILNNIFNISSYYLTFCICFQGKLFYPDGRIYEGEFDNDKSNG